MQMIFDLKNRCSVQLLSEQTVWGITSYTVYNPFLDTVYTLQADEVSFIESEPRNSIEIEADIRYDCCCRGCSEACTSGLSPVLRR